MPRTSRAGSDRSTARPADHRRAKIVEAATELFTRYGVRKTSIDAVAQTAGIAKGSVYLAFSSKDELFRAAAEGVAADILGRAETAARDDHRGIVDQVTDVLMAKFWRLFELVHARPHAGELIHARDAHAADVFRRADDRFREILTDALRRAARRGAWRARTPADTGVVAGILMAMAHGNSYGAAGWDATAYRERLRRAVELVLTGAEAARPARRR